MWNLEKLSAKELKIIAESMWLEKWKDFKANASVEEMLKVIESNNENNNDEKELEEIDEEIEEIDNNVFEVKSNLKKDWKVFKKWDKIKFFKWIEKLIEDWIILVSE